METEEIKGKFQVELKWGTYYFMCSLLLAILFSFFNALFITHGVSNSWIPSFLHLLLFIYCSIKCLNEKKAKKKMSFTSKVMLFPMVFFTNWLYFSMILTNSVFILPNVEIEIIETTEDLDKKKGNMLNDLLVFVKGRLRG